MTTVRIIEISGIDYGLSLYPSYLLPLFEVERRDKILYITKKYGACRGLVCRSIGNKTICEIPPTCSISYAQKLLGIDKYDLFRKVLGDLGIAYRLGFTLMYSPIDKLHVISSIYLSRNTDYYINTLRWHRVFLENKCYDSPAVCRGIFSSYVFQQFLEAYPLLSSILVVSPGRNAYGEARRLLSIKGIGPKTISAYLLHAYGFTEHAPIDRYYHRVLQRLGINGRIPPKKYCIRFLGECWKCPYNDRCLYYSASRIMGRLNGFVQSLIYIYYRLKTRKTPTRLEENLLTDKENLLAVMDEFLEELLEVIKNHYLNRDKYDEAT